MEVPFSQCTMVDGKTLFPKTIPSVDGRRQSNFTREKNAYRCLNKSYRLSALISIIETFHFPKNERGLLNHIQRQKMTFSFFFFNPRFILHYLDYDRRGRSKVTLSRCLPCLYALQFSFQLNTMWLMKRGSYLKVNKISTNKTKLKSWSYRLQLMMGQISKVWFSLFLGNCIPAFLRLLFDLLVNSKVFFLFSDWFDPENSGYGRIKTEWGFLFVEKWCSVLYNISGNI